MDDDLSNESVDDSELLLVELGNLEAIVEISDVFVLVSKTNGKGVRAMRRNGSGERTNVDLDLMKDVERSAGSHVRWVSGREEEGGEGRAGQPIGTEKKRAKTVDEGGELDI